MLIRTGKSEGWLRLDVARLQTWASANGINFTRAAPSLIEGRGVGLRASSAVHPPDDGQTCQLLSLPEDLVLSIEAVKRHALFDRDLRELLHSLGDLAQTPRCAILTFLLFQASMCSPSLSERIGVHGPFTDYVKSLPCELLPTFWTPEELQLLVGTTLGPAIASKLRSLQREYDGFCDLAGATRWFKAVSPSLSFDDWLQADAMFRSRALDFHGSCMIPGIDLASHAAGDSTNAMYDRDQQKGIYFLRLIESKSLEDGQEVTITYGDEKGACEMLFSYGFIDDHMESAETLFLGLSIPDSDISRSAKMKIADCAPGFKLIDVSGNSHSFDRSSDEGSKGLSSDVAAASNAPSGDIDWTGDFVWLLCVDSDDGLQFQLARTVDGEGDELQATFNGEELDRGAAGLRSLLAQSKLWPVYRLRAIVILQQRVYDQLELLYNSQEQVEAIPHGEDQSVRPRPFELALQLRRLEFELLEKAYEDFEKQKVELAENEIVKDYLARMASNDPSAEQPEQDFA